MNIAYTAGSSLSSSCYAWLLAAAALHGAPYSTRPGAAHEDKLSALLIGYEGCGGTRTGATALLPIEAALVPD